MLAGLVIFPIVYTFGLEPTLGSELAFSTLPRAFEIMPAALSYSVVDLRLGGAKVLDLLDDTVGTLGLPVAALILSVAFTRFFPARVLRSEIDGERPSGKVMHFAAKYIMPAVLLVVTVSRIVAGFDFPGWHWIPDAPYIGRTAQALTLLAFVVVLVGSILYFIRKVGNRR
jgi:NSS family neurotransmitter:Na+ symporter